MPVQAVPASRVPEADQGAASATSTPNPKFVAGSGTDLVRGTETDPAVEPKTYEHEPGVTRVELAGLGTSHRMMALATRGSLAVAVALLGLKAYAWNSSGSVAMLASAVDSSLDALASAVTLVVVRWSLAPADHEHRFGHGKLEPLAGLVQAALVLTSATALLQTAIHRLTHPTPMAAGWLGLLVMGVASAATFGLLRYQRRVVALTGSTAIRGDSLHYATDLAMNAAVALSILATWSLGWLWVDPVLGLVVAVLAGRSAVTIGWEAVQLLIDRELPEADRAHILEIIGRHPVVLGVHDLRTRRSGLQRFVQFHLEFPADISLREAHRVGHAIETEVCKWVSGAEVIVHFDPMPEHDEDHRHPPTGMQ